MRITHLGETGHCRVGWATRRAELQAPVSSAVCPEPAPSLAHVMSLAFPSSLPWNLEACKEKLACNLAQSARARPLS